MKTNIRKTIEDIFLFVLLYGACICTGVIVYLYFNFGIVSIDKFLATLPDVFQMDWAVKKIQLYSIILLFVSFGLFWVLKTKHIILLSIISLLFPVLEFDLVNYYRYKNTTLNFYKENYVKPSIEKDIKNNLIIVYLESFEKQFADDSVSPFLAEMSKKHISFDGYHQVSETFSTIHSQFASLCGLSLGQNSTFTGDGYINFLPNVDCIPDLLKQNGYTTAYFKGADLNFSRANYFTEQHNFDIAKGFFQFQKDASALTENFSGNEFGGLKDRVLFKLAENEISKLKEPFFVSLTTLDTHGAPEVFYDPECERKFDDMRDAARCTSLSLEKFVNWLKKQPFWNRTTLVIMGDHQMASRIFSTSQTFNVIINSAVNTLNKKRKFTTYDFAPTILEAMGYNVAKFGIGRSLFRDEQTLFEKEKNKFKMLIASKDDLYESLRKFDNTKAKFNDYSLGTKLDNSTLFDYVDFGEKTAWCNRSTYISMTLNNLPKNGAVLKMKFLKMNEPFKIFANSLELYENKLAENTAFREETMSFEIPTSAFDKGNKLSIKIDWPYNNVNRVFGLCIKELSVTEKM